GLAAGSCAGLLRDARVYLAAAARTASVSEAIAITANRFQTARRSGSEGADGMRLQATAVKVYFGFFAHALDAQTKAGKTLAAEHALQHRAGGPGSLLPGLDFEAAPSGAEQRPVTRAAGVLAGFVRRADEAVYGQGGRGARRGGRAPARRRRSAARDPSPAREQ